MHETLACLAAVRRTARFSEPPLNNVDQFRKMIEGCRPTYKPFLQNTHFSAAIAVSPSTRKSAKACKGPKLDLPISLHMALLSAARLPSRRRLTASTRHTQGG